MKNNKIDYELQIAERFVVPQTGLYYYLARGTVNLYITDSVDGKPLRYLNDYTAPALIPLPKGNDNSHLVLSVVEHCEIVTLQPAELAEYAKENIPEIAKLLDETLQKGVTFIRYPQDKVKANWNIGNNIADYDCQLISKTEGVMWIAVDGNKIKLYNRFDPTPTQIYPVSSTIWYQVSQGTEYSIIPTIHLLQSGMLNFEHLLFYWTSLFYIDGDRIKNNITNSMTQLHISFENNKGNLNYSKGKLLKLIAGRQKEVDDYDETDALMGCLQLIGKYEHLNFTKPSASRPNLKPLDNILRSSNIRGYKVTLVKNWYKSNNVAYLTFSKEDNSPVALIPNKKKGYDAVYYTKKTTKRIIGTDCIDFELEVFAFSPKFETEKLTGKYLYKYALSFVKKELKATVVIGCIGAIIALLIPIMNGYIFDNVIPDSSTSLLLQIFLLLLAVVVGQALLNFSQALNTLRLEGVLDYKLQAAVFDRLLSLKLQFFKQYSSGDLTERAMGVDKIRQILSGQVISSVIAFIFSIFYLGLLFYYSIELALIGLCLGLIICIFTVFMCYGGFQHIKIVRYLDVLLSGFLFQIISGITKIRTTNGNERVFSQWVGRFSVQKQHLLGKNKLNVIGDTFGAFFPIFSGTVIFIVVYNLLLGGNSDFTIGNYTAFNSAFICFQGALLQMSFTTVPLLTIKPVFDTFKPIMEANQEYTNEHQDCGVLEGDIMVNNLSFRYSENNPLIIDNISFHISKGEYVAFVGGSGAGKSTILRLLLGFEDPTSGEIFYDKKPISKLNIRDVRSQMGVVLQNGKLMQGTVLYNIIGNTDMTEEDAWNAARRAGCAEEIEKLPDKMYTEISASSDIMSGGQIQRLIIAKALAKKPKILFLDEATSALDNATQRIVSDNIENLDATRIVIAHRLSTIKNAHRIICMSQGRIVEEGTFEKLMQIENGFFKKLAEGQFA
ncbi:MAG: NHLP bacteriocin export ABC transporter permease/ATPase subunit [Ignavibacteria bacterium]|jgi:ATP-binding cassette subfamily C protein|nr:NHLP bacteriocin export ABC transporter permease/ATPase subunit [Ignavibacteria bacterium]